MTKAAFSFLVACGLATPGIGQTVTNANDNTVSVFKNTSPGAGTISYETKEDYATGTSPWSVSIGGLPHMSCE